MFLIGITGGIASGKSTVSKIFSQEYQIPVVDADLIARKVVEPNRTGWLRVKTLFGNEILNVDQTINRDKLGGIIFANETKRKQLNKSLHNLIAIEMIKQIILNFLKGYKYILLDVPLLFEVKSALKFISYKIVVDCDEETQLERLLSRNPELSQEDALLRIRSQMKREERLKLADFIIDNSGDLEKTRKQIDNLIRILNKSKRHWYIRITLSGILLISIYYLRNLF